MELIQFGLRKSEKCKSMKKGQHAKYKSEWDVYFTDSHLIWCHYARARLFSRRKERGEQRDFRMPPNPLRASVLFWRSRAMQRSGRVYDHDSSTLPPLLGHSSRPEVGKLPCLWHYFLNFLLECDGKRMKARSMRFAKARCVVESPSQMALCRATIAAPDSHRWRLQKEKMAFEFEPNFLISGLEMSRQRVRSTSSVFNTCLSHFDIRPLMFVHFYLGACMLCFCFHIPTLTSLYSRVREHWKGDIAEQYKGQKRSENMSH